MALNPVISKDSAGVYWLKWTPDATAEGYAFTTPTGSSRTFNPNISSVKLGTGFTEPVTATVGVLDVTARTPETAVYPAAPPPTGAVIDVFPGEFSAKFAAVKDGQTLRLRGGIHKGIVVNRVFQTRVTLTCDPDTLVKGVDIEGAGGLIFDTFYSQLLPADVNNDLSNIGYRAFKFYLGRDIRVIRSRIEGGFVAFYPNNASNIELRESDVWGAWGDLIHSRQTDGLVIDHNYLHDPRHLTGEHHDCWQPESTTNVQFTRNHCSWLNGEGRYTGPNTAYLGQCVMLSGNAGHNDTIVIANNLMHHYNGRPINMNNSSNVTVVNNTALDCGDGISLTVGSNVSNVQEWNNLWEKQWEESGGTCAFADYNWKTGGNFSGAHDGSGDPGLVDRVSYRPTAGSPLHGRGVNRAGTPVVDRDGVARDPSRVTIGCYA